MSVYNLYNLENIVLPSLALLIGCSYQLYSIMNINIYKTVKNKVSETTATSIILSSLINLSLLLIHCGKIVNIINEYGLVNFFVIGIIIILILSGLLITIIPALYLTSKNDEYIFCNCDNGLAELTYIPSEKSCCKSCNPKYKLKEIIGNKICEKRKPKDNM